MRIDKAITKDVQDGLTPNGVLNDLLEGNGRFVSGNANTSDTGALVQQTTTGQYPKAVILSCIDFPYATINEFSASIRASDDTSHPLRTMHPATVRISRYPRHTGIHHPSICRQ